MAVVRITGDKAVDQALAGFETKLQKQLIKKSLRKAAKIVEQEMKVHVPVDKGLLKKTIKTRAAKRSRKNTHIVSVVVKTDEKLVAKINRGSSVYNPHWMEYGAPGANVPAQPYARPAMDAKKGNVLSLFQQELTSNVEAAAKERS